MSSSNASSTCSPNNELENFSKSRAGLLFQELLNGRKALLEPLCYQASRELIKVPNMPELISDDIRSAIGKTKLLIRKEFAIFQELITRNLNDSSTDKPVTVDELVAFWSLIKLELQDIQALFDKVSVYRASGWVLPAEEVKPKRSPTSREVTKARAVTTAVPRPNLRSKGRNLQEMIKEAKAKDDENDTGPRLDQSESVTL